MIISRIAQDSVDATVKANAIETAHGEVISFATEPDPFKVAQGDCVSVRYVIFARVQHPGHADQCDKIIQRDLQAKEFVARATRS